MRAVATALAALAGSTLAITGACAGSKPAPAPPEPTIASMAELARLMKNDINPVFSRLTFLVFHGESVETDPAALQAELVKNAAQLQVAIARLRAIPKPPTSTDEGRAVFFTYADSVSKSTEQLLEAIARREPAGAAAKLEQIADTCNSCHHFFRLKIEDSVVPSRAVSSLY